MSPPGLTVWRRDVTRTDITTLKKTPSAIETSLLPARTAHFARFVPRSKCRCGKCCPRVDLKRRDNNAVRRRGAEAVKARTPKMWYRSFSNVLFS